MLRYFCEPHRGILHDTNRCLDSLAPDCDFFAMIDDDEVPGADWLNPLRRADVLNGFSPWASKPGRKIIDRLCRAAGRFAASNARLAQNTGLPLAEYGYDLPPAPRSADARRQLMLESA